MRALLAAVLLCGASVGLAAPSAGAQGAAFREIPSQAPDLLLTGVVRGADHERYRRLPFALPTGTERLVVDFDYDGRDQRTVIDLGLEDQDGIRGWSGGSKTGFTIALHDATPGYRPGRLQAGQWQLLLGLPNVRPQAEARFTARIWFIKEDRIDSLPDRTAGRGPGWYRGDLHLHTGHSDGKCPSQSGAPAPCPLLYTVAAAAARGLDFISLTDHNTLSHVQPLREAQAHFDQMLLIPGVEITSFFGHANAIGVSHLPNFPDVAEKADGLQRLAAEIHRRGGLLALNHPDLPSGEECMGCGWRLPAAKMPPIDAIEVANGGTITAANGRYDTPVSGLNFWTQQLAAGRTATAIGGSDNHNGQQAASSHGAIGKPTTVVWAADLTKAAILAGIAAGRVFIDLEGTKDRMIDLAVTTKTAKAQMGDTLDLLAGAAVQAEVSATALPAGARLELWDGASQLPLNPAPSSDTASSSKAQTGLRLKAGLHALHPAVRGANGDLLLLGNPIRLRIRQN